jgi:hypothetical protein
MLSEIPPVPRPDEPQPPLPSPPDTPPKPVDIPPTDIPTSPPQAKTVSIYRRRVLNKMEREAQKCSAIGEVSARAVGKRIRLELASGANHIHR